MRRDGNPVGASQGEEIEQLSRSLAQVQKIPLSQARSKVRAELQLARERSVGETNVGVPRRLNPSTMTFEEWLKAAAWPADRPVSEARAAWAAGEAPPHGARKANPVPLEPPADEKQKLLELPAAKLAAYHEKANDDIAASASDPAERDHASRRACWALWVAEQRGIELDRSPRRPNPITRAYAPVHDTKKEPTMPAKKKKPSAEPKVYATTYCNKGHNMKTGRPVGHECRTIPPAALRAEREGDFTRAIEIMEGRRAGNPASQIKLPPKPPKYITMTSVAQGGRAGNPMKKYRRTPAKKKKAAPTAWERERDTIKKGARFTTTQGEGHVARTVLLNFSKAGGNMVPFVIDRPYLANVKVGQKMSVPSDHLMQLARLDNPGHREGGHDDETTAHDYGETDGMDPAEDGGDFEFRYCPICGGTGALLGTLGTREHHRCSSCGMEFSHDLAGARPTKAATKKAPAAAAKKKKPSTKRPAATKKPKKAAAKAGKTDWNVKTLSAGDKAMIRMIMGNVHVGESQAAISAMWTKRMGVKNMGTPLALAVLNHAFDCDWANMRLYAATMSRRELPKARPAASVVAHMKQRGTMPSEEMVERAMGHHHLEIDERNIGSAREQGSLDGQEDDLWAPRQKRR